MTVTSTVPKYINRSRTFGGCEIMLMFARLCVNTSEHPEHAELVFDAQESHCCPRCGSAFTFPLLEVWRANGRKRKEKK